MWRWSNPDARPISEYLYDYHLSRKSHRFLYYCRDCVRNFDTKGRVDVCTRCGERSIIELPKEAKTRPKMKERRVELKIDLKTRKEIISIFTQLQHLLWRAKIATYYFLMPKLNELE